MTTLNNLGWECPVCHLGNAPFSMTCGHCTRRWEQQTPRPTGDPISCAFCKGLISPGESHTCLTKDMANKGTKICHRCQKEVVVGLVHDCRLPANTVAPPTYNEEFTSPYQGTTTSRVFMVCPVCRQETGGSHACKGTGK